ncbi:hypothetical protein [Amycolatopsis magusensis]|uniref:hypothetical protein n=1 Tax=Amycolatopsis magusensis TaxID=882444 RepID=UPI003C2FC193
MAAAATAVIVAMSGSGVIGGGTASVGSGSGSASKAGGKDAARKGQHSNAFRQLKLKNIRKKVQRELHCARHSFGQVQQFFLSNPCRELDRMLLAAGDEQGNEIAVSIAWVRMPRVSGATEFQSLVDVDGTGNVSPLGSAVLGLAKIEFTGRYYDSRRDGALVVVAEATPIGGRPSEELLHDVADVADEFPAP